MDCRAPLRAVWAIAGLLCASRASAGDFRLFPGPQGEATYGLGVSADGNVLVGQLAMPDSIEAFRATLADGVVSLRDFPGGLAFATAQGASDDGSVIIGVGYRAEGSKPDGVQAAFRWTEATGLVDLGDLPGGESLAFASGVSANGSVIVGAGYPANNDFVAWRWDNGTMSALGTFDASNPRSAAMGVSADGEVVVGSSNGKVGAGENTRAFRWTQADGLVDLGDLPGGTVYASAVASSGNGLVAVGSSSSADSGVNALEACRWVIGKPVQPLGDLPGGSFASDALATNHDGSVVVGRSVVDAEDIEEAFLWDESFGMQRLANLAATAGINLGDAVLRQATGVSADGKVVVGIAQTPGGIAAFRLDLRDEPEDSGASEAGLDAGTDADAPGPGIDAQPQEGDYGRDGSDVLDVSGCACASSPGHATGVWGALAALVAAAGWGKRRRARPEASGRANAVQPGTVHDISRTAYRKRAPAATLPAACISRIVQ